jgi:hypothetical protein
MSSIKKAEVAPLSPLSILVAQARSIGNYLWPMHDVWKCACYYLCGLSSEGAK